VRRLLLALAPVAVAAALVWLVFFSSVLAVHGVEVEGTSVLTEAEVQRVAETPTDVPLATVDLDGVRARVEGLAAVESVEVHRAWPDRVGITVTERTAIAVVSREGVWRGLDESGVLFRSYPERPTGLPEVTMSATTTVEALAEAGAVISALPSELLGRVETLDVTTVDSIDLHLRPGAATVRWGSAEESTDKARVLAALMRQQPEAEVYDVTAPGRPTVRL
jgi:cell division protein FtsQ